jgi:Rod binding domain-containing protein
MTINPLLSSPTLPTANQSKIREAAQQFESILLGQILHSAHQGSGWLGTDSSADSLSDFADQQFATLLAQKGGLGLGPLITQGLNATKSSG